MVGWLIVFAADITVYVEVRAENGMENRSKSIMGALVLMGATVVPKLNNDVTHVVWKNGKKSTVDRALKKGAKVVSVLWVDR